MTTSGRRRALGQHFLAAAAARRIVELFEPRAGSLVIEIGPGRGALTAPLLAAGARVVAVEIDARLAEGLHRRFGEHEGFALVHADVLRCDPAELTAGGPARLLANLPYSITGAVLSRLFAASTVLTDLMVMVQKEVADRIVARPGGRPYGSLSLLAQYFTTPRVVLRLGSGAFDPPPDVASCVIGMPFRRPRELDACGESAYPGFVRSLFAHRRRTLLNNLKAAGLERPEEALRGAGIDPSRRPETLAREECVRLFRAART